MLARYHLLKLMDKTSEDDDESGVCRHLVQILKK